MPCRWWFDRDWVWKYLLLCFWSSVPFFHGSCWGCVQVYPRSLLQRWWRHRKMTLGVVRSRCDSGSCPVLRPTGFREIHFEWKWLLNESNIHYFPTCIHSQNIEFWSKHWKMLCVQCKFGLTFENCLELIRAPYSINLIELDT